MMFGWDGWEGWDGMDGMDQWICHLGCDSP